MHSLFQSMHNLSHVHSQSKTRILTHLKSNVNSLTPVLDMTGRILKNTFRSAT